MNRLRLCLFALFGLAALWLTSVPLAGSTQLFLSPDETAVFQSAKALAQTGSGGLQDQRLERFPWLHARSFVTLNDTAVPVGFIGMPLLVSFFVFVGLPWLALLCTPILVLVVGYLFWRWTRSSAPWIRLLTVLTWFSLPNVILYSNRGLFPNLAAVCLVAIAAYLIWEKRSKSRVIFSGAVFALALAIRPIEAFWMIPWMFCAWHFRQDRQRDTERRSIGYWLSAAAIIAFIVVLAHLKTYGSLLSIGYFLRDPRVALGEAVTSTTILATAPVRNWFPFGLHPMHVWFNVREYLLGLLWPWILALVAALALQWKKLRFSPWTALFFWTAGSTILVYGQGVYQDHIGVNVISIGNSFLRYILPCAVFVPAAIALLLQKIEEKNIRLLSIISGVCVFAIASLGFAMAYLWGSESVQPSVASVRGYAAIQQLLLHPAQTEAVIFSERSDKIFFTPKTKPVSPMPPLDEIARLKQEYPQTHIYYFGRPLDADAAINWAAHGFKPKAQFSAGNEVMYTMENLGSDSLLSPLE